MFSFARHPFPGPFACASLTGLLVLAAASDMRADGPLRRQARALVDDDGPVLLKGFNVGNWLVQEGYLMHIDSAGYKSPSEFRAKVADLVGGQAQADQFFTAWRDDFFTEADVQALKAAGGNSFRIPFHYKDVFDPVARRPIPAGFKYLDSCVAWGRRNHVHMILDLHVAPGGQNPMEHSDVPAEPGKLFAGTAADFEFYAKLTAEVWKAVAERYKSETYVSYDLINEPLVEDPGQHWRLEQIHRRVTDSIRKADKTHLIIAEGNWWGSWLQPLGPRWDENMAFSTHNYWTRVPDVKRSGQVDWSVAQNTPIWHGETGENSNVWYNIERRDLESKGIGWSWWTWKKIEGISGGWTTTATPGGYQEVLRFWQGTGSRPDAENALAALMDLAASTRLDACRKNYDVFDALFRKDHHSVGIPYADRLRDIPEDPSSRSTRLKAAEYDMGTQGVAYSDSAFMSISIQKDSAVQWNQGWSYRNDGVDVYMDWSSGEPFIGGTSPGEWVDFTVNVLDSGPHRIDLNVSTPEPGRRIQLEVDGIRLGGDIAIPETGGWTNWTDVEGPTVDLKAGRRTLRVLFPVGLQNLRALTLVSLAPVVSMPVPRGTIRPGMEFLACNPVPGGAWLSYLGASDGNAEVVALDLTGSVTGRWTIKARAGANLVFLPGAGTEMGLAAVTVSAGKAHCRGMMMR
ncbi:MAG: hypothetical protein JWP91_2581 [Fibrobacteres bacterium]|nr:hypothetical protein [Fibrobacterota bacterium]